LDEQKNINKTQKDDSSNTKKIISSSIKKILNKEIVRKLLYNIPGFNRIKNWLRKRILIFTDLLLPFIPLGFNAPYIVNRVSSFLKNHRGPLFLWAHFMDVHRPYNPPKENVLKFRDTDFSRSERKFLTMELHMIPDRQNISPTHIKNLRVLYDAEVNFVDDSLYTLFKTIDEKFKDNCLIIITSDHGESFNDHHTFGHQGSVYEELIKVPFFLIEMGRKKAVKRVDETVQLIDIPPTILDFFNINIPEDFQGESLLPLLNGDSLNRKKPVITECYQKGGFIKRNNTEGYKLISIRTDTWKYIYDEENDREFLFNLKSDPKEKNNLVYKNKNKLEEFQLIKQHHLSKLTKSTEKTKLAQAIKKIDLD
jgi:arylsulfatase A-like enzyme